METIKDNIKLERYPEYRNSGEDWLGEVPVNWELTRLGTRFFERRTKVSDKDYAALSVTKQGILPQLDSAAKTNDGDNRKLVKAGDFVINSRSDRKGSSGISNLDGSVSLINIVIEPKGINPIFCNYLFKSNGFIEEFYRNGHGIVADLWTTRYDEMKAIKIAIPSKSDQTRIAHFLDQKTAQIDQAIAQKERLIELLKERRQILIHNAVTRGLNPDVKMKESGVEWIGEVPEHWGVKPLRAIGKCQNGISKGADYFGSGFPFVSYGDVYKNIILPPEASGLAASSDLDRNFYSVKEGDVFFTRTSETVEEIGFSSTCMETIENATFSGFLIRFRPNFDIAKEFSKYYFSSRTHRAFFVKEMNLVIRASLSQELLKRLPVLLPPMQEQIIIANYLDNVVIKIATAITLKEQEIEKLKEYKATLINSAVTGKIKV
jgi:type I restriction enzyme S subunit